MSTYTISGGVTSTNIKLLAGDVLSVYALGLAKETTVSSGGKMYVSGSARNTAIWGSGSMNVNSGGSIYMTTAYIGAKFRMIGASATDLSIYTSDATLNNTEVTRMTVDGGRVNVTTSSHILSAHALNAGIIDLKTSADTSVISSGGKMIVYLGAQATGTTVSANGVLSIFSGSAQRTTVGGGTLYISGGQAESTTLLSGGSICVSSTGSALSSFLSNGVMTVLNGGVADNAQLKQANAVLDITSGGSAINTIISGNGGTMNISSGGSADRTSLYAGQAVVNVSGGGVMTDMYLSGGKVYVRQDGSVSTATIQDGQLIVSAGGSVNYVRLVGNHARLSASANSFITSVHVSAGGSLTISTSQQNTFSDGRTIQSRKTRSPSTPRS